MSWTTPSTIKRSPSLRCGRICIGRRKVNLSTVFAGQNIGIKEVSENIWLVTFMHYDLGFFDHETGRVECAENSRYKLSLMSRYRHKNYWRARRDSNSRPPGS
jgi:hypothetical protein